MKTIFGTTEKSNFIINMKDRTLSTITEKLLMIGLLLIFIADALVLFFQPLAYLSAAFVTLLGFASVLIYLIYAVKGKLSIKNPVLIPVLLLGIFTLIAHIGARNPEISLFGNTGRFEGVVALLAYLGIFLLATKLSGEKVLKKLINLFLAFGIVQSIIGILQSIPVLNFPSRFQRLLPEAIDDAFVPSGFCGSPFSLALLLSMACGVALIAACKSTRKKEKIFYGVSALLFAAVTLMTHTLSGVIGIISAFVIAGIFALANIKQEKRSLGIWAILTGITAIGFSVCLIFGEYPLWDRAIAYQDSYYNLGVSGIYPVAVEQENLYTEFWGKTIDEIKMFPLTGTGPDCLFVPQQHGQGIMSVQNSFDKSYNDYLYIAATRGIPALIAYLLLIAAMIYNGVKNIKRQKDEKGSWAFPAAAGAVLVYLIVSFVNFSTVTVTPFFFFLAGILASYKRSENDPNKK